MERYQLILKRLALGTAEACMVCLIAFAGLMPLANGDAPDTATYTHTELSSQASACGATHVNLPQDGMASWYGPGFHGHATSSGEKYDMHKFTAAHRTLPLNSQVVVTNRLNGQSVTLRINDRGPYVHGRMIDLSLAAADALDMKQDGMAPVEIRVLCRPNADQRSL